MEPPEDLFSVTYDQSHSDPMLSRTVEHKEELPFIDNQFFAHSKESPVSPFPPHDPRYENLAVTSDPSNFEEVPSDATHGEKAHLLTSVSESHNEKLPTGLLFTKESQSDSVNQSNIFDDQYFFRGEIPQLVPKTNPELSSVKSENVKIVADSEVKIHEPITSGEKKRKQRASADIKEPKTAYDAAMRFRAESKTQENERKLNTACIQLSVLDNY